MVPLRSAHEFSDGGDDVVERVVGLFEFLLSIVAEDLAGQDFIAVDQAFVFTHKRQRRGAAMTFVVGEFNPSGGDPRDRGDFGGFGGYFFRPVLSGVCTRQFE